MPGPFFWFFAVVALMTIATAIRFALRPAERTLAVLRPLSAATASSALGSFLLGWANGLMALKLSLGRAASAAAPTQAFGTEQILGGVVESFAPLILASVLLAVCWLLVAVGLRRQA